MGGIRGEFVRWFPPYMRKAPRSAAVGAGLDPLPRLGHMRKLTTVVYSGHILVLDKAIPGTSFGYVFGMASKVTQRVLQELQKGTQRLPQRSPRPPKGAQRPRQGCPKTAKGPPKVPKTSPKARKTSPMVPKGIQRPPQRSPRPGWGGIPKVGRPPRAPAPERLAIHLGDLATS